MSDDVEIELDLDNDTIVALALYAHKLDITINEAVKKILAEQIQKLSDDEL